MRSLLSLLLLVLLSGCAGFRTYTRSTLVPVEQLFACAAGQLEQMGYVVTLSDPQGGVVQGQREITGLTETARRGAAAATEIVTIGLAGGKRTRYDQVTVSVYWRTYPAGNGIDVTAGLLTVADDQQEQSPPTDAARRDARRLANHCAEL
jgi:hypothetical protein